MNLNELDKDLSNTINHANEVMGRVSACEKCPMRNECEQLFKPRCTSPLLKLLFSHPSLITDLITLALLCVIIFLLVT